MHQLRLVLCYALVTAISLSGQVTSGEILGTVRDASGGAVTDAKVTVHNLDTNATRDTVTSVDGRFRFPQLPTGSYEVRIEKAGFARYQQGPITLRLNQTADLDIALQVSAVSETISVTTDAPLINTTNAEVGVNFDVRRVAELPLAPNRNILNLALSVAGVSQLSSGNSEFTAGGVSFSVNGMRTRSNNFMIDGADTNQPSVGGMIQEMNNPDTVAEFRLITNQFLAEYGRSAGSVVNIITKSGTNNLHGSLYWFYNGNALNSRSNLDKRTFAKAPWRVQSQIGGTAGGPIIKDKTFFFGSLLRWTDHRFASGPSITGAPTAEGKTALQNLAGNRPQVAALLAHLPAAQIPRDASVSVTADGRSATIPLGTLSGAASNVFDAWQWSGRIDHRITDKHTLANRYIFDDRVQISGQSVPPGLTSNSPSRRQSIASTLNSSFTPSIYNELRASFSRYTTATGAADLNSLTIPSIEVTQLGLTGFNAADSRTAIGLALNLPQSAVYNNYQLSNTTGILKGSHSMKFGFDFRRQDQATEFNPTLRGRLTYNSLQDLINDVAQVATINAQLPGVPRIQPYRYYDYFFFVQDEWRVKSNFTLTYGLRYESPGNAFDTLIKINNDLRKTYTDPAFALSRVPTRDTNNWAPRFGFNYRFGQAPGVLRFLTGDGKLVMRGGYSRTYDLIFNNIHLNVFSSFPFTVIFSHPAATAGAFAAIDPIRAGRVVPPVTNPQFITRTTMSEDFRSPLSEQFSLQLQREIARDWAFTFGWIGTKGTALFQTVDGNPTVPVNNNRGTIRVDPTRGVERLRCNCAASIYHSLQTSLEKRLSRDFSMGAHYTWSAFIDDASEIFNPSVAGEVAVSQDSFNRRLDRGRSTYDRPHRLAINGVFELPWMREQQGLAGRTAGGWQISGFLSLQSGAPFSPINGPDPGFRLTGIDSLVGNSIRPNVNTSLDLASMSIEEIVRAGGRALFSPVTAADPIGNAGRNLLRADGINNIDLGINKNIKIAEGHRLQVRFEFYNLFNSRDYGIPQARIDNAGFGLQWDTNGGNRRIVGGLRYTF
jgi:hypothetical protein